MKSTFFSYFIVLYSWFAFSNASAICALDIKPFVPAIAETVLNTETKQQLGHDLGWIIMPDSPCEGYYLEPDLNPAHLPILPADQSRTEIEADRSILTLQKHYALEGHVFARQIGRTIAANHAILAASPLDHSVDRVDLQGQIQIREPGNLLVGDRGVASLKQHTASIKPGWYRMALTDTQLKPGYGRPAHIQLEGLSGYGTGEQLDQLGEKRYRFYNASYSTCAPTDNSWQISAKQIDIDKNTGKGKAWHSVLRLKDQPLFYWPYINFFVDKHRESGLLWPLVSYSSRDGFMWLQPYYLNWLPNVDSTLSLKWINNRNVQIGLSNRYLTPYQQGDWGASWLPHDRADRSNNRRAFFWHDKGHTNFPNIDWNVDYNWVFDDDYLVDLNDHNLLPIHAIGNNQLSQHADLIYHHPDGSAQIIWQRYQNLHPANQLPAFLYYNRLPELNWHNQFDLPIDELKFSWNFQWTSFSLNEKQADGTLYPAAKRLHLQPTLSRTFQQEKFYVTPALQWLITDYQIQRQRPDRASHIYRNMPAFTLDSGNRWQLPKIPEQTIEPRLYFSYVPYRDQHAIPIFDSGGTSYYLSQLFQLNRFLGIDRIGDTKQVTLSVTTRHLLKNNAEKWHVAVGEMIYQGHQRVETCLIPGCENDAPTPTPTSAKINPSIFAAEASYQLNALWQLQSNYSYDQQSHLKNASDLHLRYQSDKQHLLDVNYRFLRNANAAATPNAPNTKLAGIGLIWPLKNKWQAFLGWQHNIEQHYIQDSVAGVEYNTCCFALRVVAAKSFLNLPSNNQPTYNKRVFLQWELKGLGTYRSGDNTDLMVRTIPGYQK